MDALDPRKQWILRKRYFDEWSQSEVGRSLGISQMHVSRLEREALRELKRVSTPGLRQYTGSTSLPRVLNGLGVAIISTSRGVLTDKEARTLGVGGEVICYVS